MSKLINELKKKIIDAEEALKDLEDGLTGDFNADNGYRILCIPKVTEALKNTKVQLLDAYFNNPQILKMIRIAELQDELVKLDFMNLIDIDKYSLSTLDKYGKTTYYHINFYDKDVTLWITIYIKEERLSQEIIRFGYTPTWQQDVLNKVKELING